MKVRCSKHGYHFEDEFESTLDPICPFWYENDLEMLSDEDKKLVYEGYMSIPADKVLEKYDVGISITFPRGIRNMARRYGLYKNQEGYDELKDSEKRDLQRKNKIEGKVK